jgi:hypothetical protein
MGQAFTVRNGKPTACCPNSPIGISLYSKTEDERSRDMYLLTELMLRLDRETGSHRGKPNRPYMELRNVGTHLQGTLNLRIYPDVDPVKRKATLKVLVRILKTLGRHTIAEKVRV